MKALAFLSAMVIAIALMTPPVLAQPTPAPTTPTQPKAPKAPATKAAPAPVEGQFTTEADAKAKCTTEAVVWVNTSKKVYHFAGYKDYGKTKRGAYMCRSQADKAGFRAAKNEKAPAT